MLRSPSAKQRHGSDTAPQPDRQRQQVAGRRTAPAGPSTFTTELRDLVAAGRSDAAVEYFNTSIGVPEDKLADCAAPAWEAMVASPDTRLRRDDQ